mgnify:CR=1 FL=1
MKQRTRLTIQGIALLIQNANLKGFFTGKLYEGPLKQVCVPGLNCYSCPGAVGSCPVGALQNALSAQRFKLPYYVAGLLIFFGALLGRAVCGFLCPFGLLQDLLYKIPFPKKLKTFPGDKLLRKLKYLVLGLMVILLPLCIKLTPIFCKYLCPSGTLAGILLALSDTTLFKAMGSRFLWKACVLGVVSLLSVVIFRPFCRYFCPLGAIYAPFNKISLIRLNLDKAACVHCGKCAEACPMEVDPARHPDHTECIRCGKCTEVCPVQALKLSTAFQKVKTKEEA